MAGRRQKRPAEVRIAEVQDLTQDGRGVVRVEGKVAFVHGALPGEEVRFQYTRKGRDFDEGEVLEVLRASPDRVSPRCPHFGVCGGCAMQHLAPEAQVAAKQRVLLGTLERIAGVTPRQVLPPLTGRPWGYRRKARLTVKYVTKKGRVLVGFRERKAPYVADIRSCEVLHPSVGQQLEALAELVGGLEARARIPQLEVAVGDEATALVLRHLDPLGEADRSRLVAFAQGRPGIQLWLQPAGPDSILPLWPCTAELSYRIPAHGITLHFRPLDFIQVNAGINLQMVDRVMTLLDPGLQDRVLELFSGLGNFTLPMARRVAELVAVEGDPAMVRRAAENARRNGLDNTVHVAADLFLAGDSPPWPGRPYTKVLLDPPRAGAAQVIPWLGRLGASRIVYVSCHPATLARDAAELVRGWGYELSGAGVMDMFPHTAHVESVALFERPG